MDVTDTPGLGSPSEVTVSGQEKAAFPKKMHYQKQVKRVLQHISEEGPRQDLAKFSSYYTRYYRSPTGKMSQQWLQGQVEALAAELSANTTVTAFKHDWMQNSVVLHIQGRNASLSHHRGLTVLGAHLDSVNLFPWLPAPGADDDGSGTVTLLESLRALGKAGWAPESSVEFHWYSAEEGGLLGSQAIASAYQQNHIDVQAMLQMDMTAFLKEGTEERIGMVTDYVSPELTDYMERLIEAYVDVPVVRSQMDYGASDHASWNKAGVPSAFIMEAYVHVINTRPFKDCNLRRIHVRGTVLPQTTKDVMDAPEFSFPHLLQFARISAAYVVELAGWA